MINDVAERSAPSTIRVEAASVDEYVRKSGAPDFIKCDVEGAEVEVFRGGGKNFKGKASAQCMVRKTAKRC